MWLTTHGPVGSAIGLSTAVLTGSVAAGVAASIVGGFISHFILDYIGESGIGNNKQALVHEGLGSILVLFGTLHLSPQLFAVALIGWVFACLPDLIDKTRAFLFGLDQIFSCHGGDFLFTVTYKGEKYRLGSKILLKLDMSWTLAVNYGVSILYMLAVIKLGSYAV